MKSKITLLALLISTLLLSACSDTEEKETHLTDGSQNEIIGVDDASTSGLSNNARINSADMGNLGRMAGGRNGASNLGPEFTDPNNPLSKRTIYFMLDSSQVQEDFIPVIAAHAQYLVANPGQHVLLEGNADERGSREYNIALGEGRAKSVANMLKVQGVSEGQIDVISYGEEKPAAMGNDETAWELNRRVEVVYK